MLAWIFHVAARASKFPGWRGGPEFQRSQLRPWRRGKFIIEGDEYETAFFDRSPKFLHYHPDELILTSLEYDHADMYPDLASIALQFRRLRKLVPRRGRILLWGESPELKQTVAKPLPRRDIRAYPDCDWCAGEYPVAGNATEIRVVYRGNEVSRIRMPVAGRHNVLDALAAIALAYGRGVEGEPSKERLPHFNRFGAAWRSRVKRVEFWSSRILHTTRPRFG